MLALETTRDLQTSHGTRFSVLGGKLGSPGPTLFVLAASRATTLEEDNYVKCGRILQRSEAWLLVSLDVPAHGEDRRESEPEKLLGWRARLERNENFVAEFTRKASDVLDYLIQEGYTDPQRVAVAGTSRGGFMAVHFAAVDPRVKATVAFAPVTDLPVLQEFKILENHGLTKSIALGTLAEKLAGRAIWVCIGNNDQRVGTRNCFEFTQKIAAATLKTAKTAPIELHIMESEGHRIHGSAHEEAAAWLASHVKL